MSSPAWSRSTFRGLPLGQWATRFRSGRVSLRCRVPSTATLDAGGVPLRLRPGRLEVGIEYRLEVGVARVELRGAGVADVVGPLVVLRPDGIRLGQRSWEAELALEELLPALADHLADVQFSAVVRPDGDLRVRFGHGVVVELADDVTVRLAGATSGPPSALQVTGPLEVDFGSTGARVSHTHLEVLTRLADVRVSRASLDPTGRVRLEGRGARGIDLAVRGGLRTASASLSELIRHSPRFARVRAFLHGFS